MLYMLYCAASEEWQIIRVDLNDARLNASDYFRANNAMYTAMVNSFVEAGALMLNVGALTLNASFLVAAPGQWAHLIPQLHQCRARPRPQPVHKCLCGLGMWDHLTWESAQVLGIPAQLVVRGLPATRHGLVGGGPLVAVMNVCATSSWQHSRQARTRHGEQACAGCDCAGCKGEV